VFVRIAALTIYATMTIPAIRQLWGSSARVEKLTTLHERRTHRVEIAHQFARALLNVIIVDP
jgi:hypothetical protein